MSSCTKLVPTTHVVPSTMMKLVLLCVTMLAVSHGIPDSAYEVASQEIASLLQKGKDDTACADLAKALIEEVSSKVDLNDKMLAALDDGSDCPNEGQDAVKAAQKNKDDDDTAASDATAAAEKATEVDVDFGVINMNQLSEGQCEPFWADAAYQVAIKAESDAEDARVAANAKAQGAAEALTAAEEAAAKAVKTCQCKVRGEYGKRCPNAFHHCLISDTADTAWTAANKDTAADQAAYTKGKNMQCVLAGKPAADCKAGEAPKPTPVTLAAGVPTEQCQ